jgi:hypothetical protein
MPCSRAVSSLDLLLLLLRLLGLRGLLLSLFGGLYFLFLDLLLFFLFEDFRLLFVAHSLHCLKLMRQVFLGFCDCIEAKHLKSFYLSGLKPRPCWSRYIN